MKKLGKALLVLICITLYANIGWVVGSYYHHNVLRTPHEQLTTLGKVAAGAPVFATIPQKSDSVVVAVDFGIFWPVVLVIFAISWIVYFVYYAGWFIFAGGAVKLLGLV